MIFEEFGLDQAVVRSIFFGIALTLGSAFSAFLFDKARTYFNLCMESFRDSFVSFRSRFSNLAKDDISGPLSFVFAILFVFAFAMECRGLYIVCAPEEVSSEIAGIV